VVEVLLVFLQFLEGEALDLLQLHPFLRQALLVPFFIGFHSLVHLLQLGQCILQLLLQRLLLRQLAKDLIADVLHLGL
jgi:hypothetical protein